ncbi:MAG: anthranilate phosphoribosyltransferase [Gammaproteobacteria bacterium]|nr:anthranilate phosphoribosyltransferase [Gammaproteobacteria bacterium]OUT96151.1 MAG: anthranilate phosphoribosyltransferase [Gammaproteobacteria bacterium TMED36]
MNHDLKDFLAQLLNGEGLTEDQSEELMLALAEGSVEPALAGALLVSLRMKGESAEEVRGFANGMRKAAKEVDLENSSELIDIVGTGGDDSHSFNISTGAALLSAACGLKVAKHGNRSVSSKSGSADLLEFLGYRFPTDADGVKIQIKENGFSFLFAPNFHPAMKNIAPIRQALKIRTVFNILGPLTNPARPSFYLLGAFSSEMASLMASSLSGMDMKRAFVVHGLNGWDEPTPASSFELFDVSENSISHKIIDPSEHGIKKCKEKDLKGGASEVNAKALLKVFECKDKGAHKDALVLNAGLSLQVSGEVKELSDGIEIAKETIKSGKAKSFLSSLTK